MKVRPFFIVSFLIVLAVLLVEIGIKIFPDVFHSANLGDVSSFLGVILAFIAAVNYLLYELNKKDIEMRTKDIAEESQNFAAAKAHFTTAYALWTYYHCHCETLGDGDKGKHIQLINQAIIEARCSVDYVSKLNLVTHEELLCNCKNNLAFFLAVRDMNDEKEVRKHAEDIYRVAMNKNKVDNFKRSYMWEATWALVLWRFYEKDIRSKKMAYEIVNELLKNPMIAPDVLKNFQDGWKFIGGKPFHQIMESLKAID